MAKLDKEILEYTNEMLRENRRRIEIQKDMRRRFALKWKHPFAGKPNWVIKVRNPHPHNSIMWLGESLAYNPVAIEVVVPEDALRPDPKSDKNDEAWAKAAKRFLNSIRWFYELVRPRIKAETMGKKLQNIVKTILDQNDERLGKSLQWVLTLHSLVDGQIAVGASDLRMRTDWDTEANRGKSPFVIKPIDPTHVCIKRDDMGIGCAVYSYLTTLHQVRKEYPKAKLEGIEENEKIIRRECWERERKVIWIQPAIGELDSDKLSEFDGLLEDSENTLGVVPFIVENVEGLDSMGEDAEIIPFLYAASESGVSDMNDLHLSSIASTEFRMTANPQLFHEKQSLQSSPLTLHLEKPYIYEIQQGEKIGSLNLGSQADAQLRSYSMTQQLLHESTASPVVGGSEPGGVTSASGVSLLQHGSLLRSTLPEIAISRTYQQIVQHLIHLIRLGDEIEFPNNVESGIELFSPLGFLEIEPKELPTYVHVSISTKPKLPQEIIAMGQLGALMLDKGVWSLDEVRRQINTRDIEKVKTEIDQDREAQLQTMKKLGGKPAGNNSSSDVQGLPSQAVPPNVQKGMVPQDVTTRPYDQEAMNAANMARKHVNPQ